MFHKIYFTLGLVILSGNDFAYRWKILHHEKKVTFFLHKYISSKHENMNIVRYARLVSIREQFFLYAFTTFYKNNRNS